MHECGATSGGLEPEHHGRRVARLVLGPGEVAVEHPATGVAGQILEGGIDDAVRAARPPTPDRA